jgi:hypothetical protein
LPGYSEITNISLARNMKIISIYLNNFIRFLNNYNYIQMRNEGATTKPQDVS